MAGVQRWNAKWDDLEVDSDGEDTAPAPDLDQSTLDILKRFPPDVARELAQQKDPQKRDALLALNCYVCELHNTPRETPSMHQQLLGALCMAMRGLREGGENETLLVRIMEVLVHPRVDARHVEQAIGAMALMDPTARETRMVQVVLRAALQRCGEFSAQSLARACWAGATLGNSEATAALLYAAVPLVEKRAPDFQAADVALFAWACAVSQPPGARVALSALLDGAELPLPDTRDAQVTAWALEAWGFNATPFFGMPPVAVPRELAAGLHDRLKALDSRDGVQQLHAGGFPLLCVSDILVPEEAVALLEVAEGRWRRSPNSVSGDSDWRSFDIAVLETPAALPVPIVERVRRRATKLLGLPESHCEAPQISRHLHGERYHELVDYFSGDRLTRGLLYLGGQRVATVRIYLSALAAESGGQTIFPKLGVSFPAKLGNALIWSNVGIDGNVDEQATHATAPILDDRSALYVLDLFLHAYPVSEAERAPSTEAIAVEANFAAGAATVTQLHPGETQVSEVGRVPESAAISAFQLADDLGLPSVPVLPRPRAAPGEPRGVSEEAEVCEKSWEELGCELRSVIAELDLVSDAAVRHATRDRLREGERLSAMAFAAASAAGALGPRPQEPSGSLSRSSSDPPLPPAISATGFVVSSQLSCEPVFDVPAKDSYEAVD